ncbi:MAG TPA: hypothetical protein VGD98_24040 [Ktedonobacteraceae bacterium]
MNRQADENIPEDQAQSESAKQVTRARSLSSLARYLRVAWLLLLLLGALFLFGSLSDLLADGRNGLPSDHLTTFSTIAGISWNSAQQSSPGITRYITTLEITYAVHELVFGLLFLMIVAIPFRRLARWAWWACWVPMLANLTYTLTIGQYSTTTLVYSLIADVLLPILLLLYIPAFFGKSRQTR